MDSREDSYIKAKNLLNALREVYQFQMNYQKSFKDFAVAPRINPDHISTLKNKGDLSVLKGDWAGAIEMYNAVLQDDPQFLEIYLKLGALYDRLNEPEKAIDSFRGAIAAAPFYAPAYNNAAWLLAREGKDLDEARAMAMKAIELDPNYSDAYDTLGWIYYLIGLFDEAMHTLQHARTIAGDQPNILAHLALVYYEKGMNNKSLSVLKKATGSKKNPPDAPAHQ